MKLGVYLNPSRSSNLSDAVHESPSLCFSQGDLYGALIHASNCFPSYPTIIRVEERTQQSFWIRQGFVKNWTWRSLYFQEFSHPGTNHQSLHSFHHPVRMGLFKLQGIYGIHWHGSEPVLPVLVVFIPVHLPNNVAVQPSYPLKLMGTPTLLRQQHLHSLGFPDVVGLKLSTIPQFLPYLLLGVRSKKHLEIQNQEQLSQYGVLGCQITFLFIQTVLARIYPTTADFLFAQDKQVNNYYFNRLVSQSLEESSFLDYTFQNPLVRIISGNNNFGVLGVIAKLN